MISDIGLKQSDLQVITDIIKKYSTIDSAVIFGSRAKGNFRSGSDVDIALFGKDIKRENILDINFLLNEETLMPYHFDILDFNTIQNPNLAEHIRRVGKVLYQK